MKRIIFVVILAMTCGACNKYIENANTFNPDEVEKQAAPPKVNKPMNPGDVEAYVYLETTVQARSEADNVKVDVLADDLRKRITLVSANIEPPCPKSFWVTAKLMSKPFKAEAPIVVRVTLSRVREDGSKEKIGGFSHVIPTGPQEVLKEAEFDVFAGLAEPPSGFTVRTEGEALLMPADTAVESIDPETAEAPAEMRGVILGNPISISIGAKEEPFVP